MTLPMALLVVDYGAVRWSSELLAKIGLIMGAVTAMCAVVFCLHREPVGRRMPLWLDAGAGVLSGIALLSAPGRGLSHVVGIVVLGLTTWLAWDQRGVSVERQ